LSQDRAAIDPRCFSRHHTQPKLCWRSRFTSAAPWIPTWKT